MNAESFIGTTFFHYKRFKLFCCNNKFVICHSTDEGSLHRENVNEALLTLKENGEYDKIYRKWFGEVR
ncbi:MAG: transporter substrate-binding domain-containing protein [Desulfobacterales bacterium]|nr:transporter substrate-binding domain-containing protein [Desulfobacterales bacterium]MCP4161391.1 transporter substrate-binding domain-containing protein [Deltaproteobacteria bacterium]